MNRRNRLTYTGLILLTLLAGLASRYIPDIFPNWYSTYAGDTLWALLVFWLFGWTWRSISSERAGLLALAFAYAIELSQFYQADWLNALRSTWLGAMVLGHGFLWSDLICYTVGISIGFFSEKAGLYRRSARSDQEA